MQGGLSVESGYQQIKWLQDFGKFSEIHNIVGYFPPGLVFLLRGCLLKSQLGHISKTQVTRSWPHYDLPENFRIQPEIGICILQCRQPEIDPIFRAQAKTASFSGILILISSG